MTKQLCLRGLKPSRPTIQTKRVAEAIATRIVKEVNLDDFYWTPSELPDRIEDVTQEIMRCGNPATVFTRLRKSRGATDPYGWEGINEHCRHIGDEIASEELQNAIDKYFRDF